MEDTLATIKRLVEEQLGVDQDQVHESSSFIADLGADSLDAVEFIMAAEEEFNIEIEDEQAEKVATVADAVKLIDEIKAKMA